MSKQRKTRKRTIIDIIGEEDYMEFRDVIDDQLVQQEKEDQLSGQASPDPLLSRKGKAKKTHSRKKSGKSGSRRKTIVQSTQGAGGNESETLQAQLGILRSTQAEQDVSRVMELRFDSISPKKGLDQIEMRDITLDKSKTTAKKPKRNNSSSDEDDDDSNGNENNT